MSSRSAKRMGASPGEVFPDPAWWVPGLAPHERGQSGTDVRPEWVGLVEQAVLAAGASRDAADQRTGFGVRLRGLVAVACDRLVMRAGPCLAAGGVEPDAVAERFAEQLTERLVAVAARTFERELGGPFTGEGEPGRLARLFTTYPVLARLLGDTARFAVDAHVELLRRFAADRVAVVEALFGGVDPGPVVAVEAGKGDSHRGGRSVSVVVFGGGARVVYRPREVGPHRRFTELVGWVNRVVPGIGLRTVAVVAGDGYGWLEFVAGASPGCADRYYRRQGVLLALLHATRTVDVHYQNMIADGDQPVLVDVETLFHPRLPDSRAADPAGRALAASVYRTGLLPQFVVGAEDATDISGLGPDAVDHRDALLAGFRCGYDAILRHRGEFAAFVERCVDLPVRIVVRPTRLYTTLLGETTGPELLRDARDRDRVFAAALTGDAGLVRHELADLWAGDVPLFLGRAGGHDIELPGGRRLAGVFDRTGTRDAVDTVAAMCEGDRRDQEWIISAAMATRRPAGGHGDGTPLPGRVTGTVADPERLLAAACAIGDRIVARSMADRERVNWLGLELVDERQWLVLPMGAGLANGYLGVALFLAQLGELSGVDRYGQVARQAVSAVPPLFETMAAHPAMVAAVGRGGLHGLGGIAFGLARIAVLLADDELRDLTRIAVDLAASAEPDSPCWATGTAGCLAAMTAVHAELELPAAARLAEECAAQLLSEVDRTGPAGFADGAAGIAFALRRCVARHTVAARAEAFVEAERAGWFGWCGGLAGLVLASPAADVTPWVRALTERPLLRDFSLCHGELGIADVLTAIPGAEPVRRRYAGLVLDAIDRYGPRCGTPDGVPTPGLLTGLAGIGYGLLRLGFANQVPSALLLEKITGGKK